MFQTKMNGRLRKSLTYVLAFVMLQTSYAPIAEAKNDFPSFKTQSFRGDGDDIVDFETDKRAIVRFSCPACTSNTVLKTDGPESLLVNEIGSYTGEHLINMKENSLTTSYEIEANSSWTLSISDLNSVRRVTGNSVSGQGTSVVYVSSTNSKVLVKNVGMSNFIVYTWPIKQPAYFSPLLINEIGSYKGTKRIKTPGLITIQSQGKWSLVFSK
jgi:hypothetical protein